MTTLTKLKVLGVILAVAFSIIVVMQNTEPINAKILFIRWSMPAAVLLGLTLSVGVILGLMLSYVLSHRRKQAK